MENYEDLKRIIICKTIFKLMFLEHRFDLLRQLSLEDCNDIVIRVLNILDELDGRFDKLKDAIDEDSIKMLNMLNSLDSVLKIYAIFLHLINGFLESSSREEIFNKLEVMENAIS
ncbi:MAG: hypothetical protein ACTSRP_01865 [Candidatus Helarchaeota archaeon]